MSPPSAVLPTDAHADHKTYSGLELIARERHVLGQIAHGVPLAEVLTELLRAVEAQRGHTMLASILIISEDGKHLCFGAAPSIPSAYSQAIDGIAIREGVGSCGTAAALGAPVYTVDIATDPNWVDYRDLALGHNLRACWSTPIKAANGDILGTFAIYDDVARAPTDGDVESIAFVTQAAALAIERHFSDLELKLNQEHLRRANDGLETANKLLAERVATVEGQQDRLWRNSLDLLAVAEMDATLAAVNNAWTAILGWTETDLVGGSLLRFVHPEDLEATIRVFASVAETLFVETFEFRLRVRDDSYRTFSWTAGIENGQIFANGRDVTAERDQALRLSQTEAALRQSQKMEAVGQLTGGLAHDFNNLLTGIMGNLEILQDRGARGRFDDFDRYINVAMGGAKRAASLTQRLLAFARRQTLDPRPADVNKLIVGLEELLRRSVGPMVEIEVVQAAGLWTANIDAMQLENAIINLCINGRDAMPRGGRLTIETANKWIDDRTGKERDLVSGQYLSVCVSDNGTGMSIETMSRAFEPFYTTKPIGEGTGLGLSMIYGFARQSGGDVRIYSEIGQGSTVCIYLPRHTKGLDKAEIEDGVAAMLNDQETIVVVEDEVTIRNLIAEVLSERAYNVITAADGIEGLRELRAPINIDLLVTDVGLPNGINGRQVADAARALRPGLKVLFITGYAENAAVGNGYLEPGMELLTKPFTVNSFVRKIGEMLDPRQALV
jgi:PAS domain S-box-containing protein